MLPSVEVVPEPVATKEHSTINSGTKRSHVNQRK